MKIAAVLTLAACGLSVPPAAADTIATVDAFLPAVHLKGATGTYRTDVEIFNPDPSANATVKLYFAEADSDGTSANGLQITPDLYPRESVSLPDILSTIFRAGETYGLLEIRSSRPILVTSNTYNATGSGTFGQFSPGQPYRNSLGFDNRVNGIYGDLYVTGLPNDGDHRTNAVVMNPTEYTLEAGVQLVDRIGQIYGTKIYRIKPYSMHQINDVFGSEFASTGVPPGGPYRLNLFVNLSNRARILGYATVTDRRTGDPYLIPAQAMQDVDGVNP